MATKNPNKFQVQAQSNYTERAEVKWGYFSSLTIQVPTNAFFNSLNLSPFLFFFSSLLLFNFNLFIPIITISLMS
jgi:hypothetical protein